MGDRSQLKLMELSPHFQIEPHSVVEKDSKSNEFHEEISNIHWMSWISWAVNATRKDLNTWQLGHPQILQTNPLDEYFPYIHCCQEWTKLTSKPNALELVLSTNKRIVTTHPSTSWTMNSKQQQNPNSWWIDLLNQEVITFKITRLP
jgi:hypothetical protein